MKPRIRIRIPFHTSITPECQAGVRDCLAQGHIDWGNPARIAYRASNIVHGRNFGINGDRSLAVQQDVADLADYFLFVDADTGFSFANVEKLLAHNRSAVAGLYRAHAAPHPFVAGYFHPEMSGMAGERVPETAYGLTRVDWAGMGFMLIKASLFAQLPYPWFHQAPVYTQDAGFRMGFAPSESCAFGLELKKAGIQLYVDAGVRLEHIPPDLEKSGWDFTRVT